MSDKWSGFADLLANLIEKYAEVLDIDQFPDPPRYLDTKNNFYDASDPIEKGEVA